MISGCMALLAGLFLMITAARSKADYFHGKKNFILITYGVFILTVVFPIDPVEPSMAILVFI